MHRQMRWLHSSLRAFGCLVGAGALFLRLRIAAHGRAYRVERARCRSRLPAGRFVDASEGILSRASVYLEHGIVENLILAAETLTSLRPVSRGGHPFMLLDSIMKHGKDGWLPMVLVIVVSCAWSGVRILVRHARIEMKHDDDVGLGYAALSALSLVVAVVDGGTTFTESVIAINWLRENVMLTARMGARVARASIDGAIGLHRSAAATDGGLLVVAASTSEGLLAVADWHDQSTVVVTVVSGDSGIRMRYKMGPETTTVGRESMWRTVVGRLLATRVDDSNAKACSCRVCSALQRGIDALIVEIRGRHPDAVRVRSARRIQRAWRVCVADPAFLACRRRLGREFVGLRCNKDIT